MNFIIDKEEFKKGLELVKGVISKKASYYILSYVLMEWENDSLYIAGTDLETSIKVQLDAKTEEAGRIMIPFQKLYKIIKELPKGNIKVEKNGDKIIIECEKLTFCLACSEEFLSLPSCDDELFAWIPSHTLESMIEKTIYAACDKERGYGSKLVINSIYVVQAGNILRTVATDEYQLSLIDMETERINGLQEGVIIPKKGIMEVKRLLKNSKGKKIGIYFDKTNAFFKIGKLLITIKLIGGRFPQYEPLISKIDNDKRLLVERDKLHDSLKRISAIVNGKEKKVKIQLKDNLMKLSSSYDDREIYEEIDISYEGLPIEIGFNVEHLINALNAIDENQILIELKNKENPCVIRPSTAKNQLFLTMPIEV